MASVYLPFKVSLSSQPPAQREVGAGVFFVNQTGERCVHRKSHITPAPQNAVKYVRSEHALAREAASDYNMISCWELEASWEDGSMAGTLTFVPAMDMGL